MSGRAAAIAGAAAVGLLAAAMLAFLGSSLPQQLSTGAAVAAKQTCSLVFVSGLDLDRAREWYVAPLLRGGSALFRTRIDRERRSATVRIPGLARRSAAERAGYGCTLVPAEGLRLEGASGPTPGSAAMAIDRAHRAARFDGARLDAALARAFEPGTGPQPLNTLAVVVLHEGRLVAERYAAGVGPEMRLPGWSMTKSVTASLAGVLAQQGRIDVHAPGAIREWRRTSDPRARITLDHLLRMTSGLLLTEHGETGDGLDPTTRMLYVEPDAAHFAATRALQREPGSHFEYMSGNTILAMRALQDAIGGGPDEAREFVQRHLFAPLGMQGTVLETDPAGTFLGSSHMLASARDWARLGGLYVDGGVAGDRRLISEEWIRYVATPTEASSRARRGDVFWEPGRTAYGAGFWLLGEGSPGGLPPDSFDANGFQGQYVHIVPSRKLVVVRLGATNFRGHDHERLPRDVLEAMR